MRPRLGTFVVLGLVFAVALGSAGPPTMPRTVTHQSEFRSHPRASRWHRHPAVRRG